MTIIEALSKTNRENRIKRSALARLTQINDRTLREKIHELRMDGYQIIGDTSAGGYYLGTEREWDEFCDQQRRRAINNFYRKSNESRIMDGQIRIV